MSHFWDEEKVVGRWLGDDPSDVIPDSALFFILGGVVWDTYLLFGPQALWGQAPTDLISFGGPVIASPEQLKADLLRLLERQ